MGKQTDRVRYGAKATLRLDTDDADSGKVHLRNEQRLPLKLAREQKKSDRLTNNPGPFVEYRTIKRLKFKRFQALSFSHSRETNMWLLEEL